MTNVLHPPTGATLFAVWVCAAFAHSHASSQSPLLFNDVTSAVGITWVNFDPPGGTALTMGAGGGFLDYDGDGLQDILLVGGASTPALYRNLGNGMFADVTSAAGLALPPAGEWYMSVTVGDIDNDGDPDVYLGRWGTNVMFRNNGDGTFSDVTDPVTAGAAWTTSAAFGDYDRDGLLDLYVGNYVANPVTPTGFPNRLLRNNGDGTFRDVSAATGVAGVGTTLAVSWSDWDGDGDVDLWVGNDFGSALVQNRLYRNDGPGPTPGSWQLVEVAQSQGANLGIFCMGIAGGDIDRDLDLDYYFTNIGRNVLLRNDGPQGFVDITTATGTENTYDPTTSNPPLLATSWGAGFFDFDRDGWLDLYVSDGWVPAAGNIVNGSRTPNVLFHHDGAAMTYTDVSVAGGVAHQGIGRAAAFADYDRDGDVDILQVNVNGPPLLLRNDSPAPGEWLKVKTTGRLSPRDAVGARVQLDFGSFSLLREVKRNFSYQASSDPTLHFGFGTETVVRRLSARWPSGITQEYWSGVPSRFVVPLVEPVVTVGPGSRAPATVREGTVLDMALEIVNQTAVPQTAFQLLEIRAGGRRLANGALTQVVVPAGGMASVPFRVFVPVGATGGNPVTLEFLWTAFDVGGGLDQFRAEVAFTP